MKNVRVQMLRRVNPNPRHEKPDLHRLYIKYIINYSEIC